jgi:hypothetical protein
MHRFIDRPFIPFERTITISQDFVHHGDIIRRNISGPREQGIRLIRKKGEDRKSSCGHMSAERSSFADKNALPSLSTHCAPIIYKWRFKCIFHCGREWEIAIGGECVLISNRLELPE